MKTAIMVAIIIAIAAGFGVLVSVIALYTGDAPTSSVESATQP